ncbi:hypothetical protein [Pseudocnuella soli]|uniref:hypothetical protein n=1 Tax=Pseudocnuella soli TaxID=2502779 RepID=UPI00140491EF|nr:hypothetical protein [Pseudocnuella soli]
MDIKKLLSIVSFFSYKINIGGDRTSAGSSSYTVCYLNTYLLNYAGITVAVAVISVSIVTVSIAITWLCLNKRKKGNKQKEKRKA